MNILIVDKNEISAQLLKAKLEKLNYEVDYADSAKSALPTVAKKDYEIIIMDPTPTAISKAEPMIVDIRRACQTYTHIILTAADVDQMDTIRASANDCMGKIIDQDVLIEHLENASRLSKMVQRIGDTSEDFPSAGGVIAKSAFNQLFSAAIDRAGRYGEMTYVLFVSLSNYDDIFEKHGKHTANLMAATFSQLLVSIRRQSDIIGQTKTHEYALLLQRPNKRNEPEQAAQRFAKTLQRMLSFDENLSGEAQMHVKLVELPTGQLVSDYEWTVSASTQQQSA